MIVLILANICLAQEIKKRDVPDLIINDNIGQIKTASKSIFIDKVYANSGDGINIYAASSETIKNLCFEFPIESYKIKIETPKIIKPLWFDENLKTKEQKELYKICYNDIDLQDETMYFKPLYLGRGIIKYNITFDDVVLDPYLVGSLATSNSLLLYYPFNNTIDAAWSSIENDLTAVDTRFNGTEYTTAYAGTCDNPSLVYDDSYATAGGGSSCSYYIDFYKDVADTGMKVELKEIGPTGLWGMFGCLQGEQWRNVTIPDSCFNQYTNKVSLQYYNYGGTSWGVKVYCDNGAWTEIDSCTGSAPNPATPGIYESGVYITNESAYVATTLLDLNQSYYINGTAGYDFKFNKNSNDIFSSYDGTDGDITYNNEGAVFNNATSAINTTFNPNHNNQSFGFGAKFKPYAVFNDFGDIIDFGSWGDTSYSQRFVTVANTLNVFCVSYLNNTQTESKGTGQYTVPVNEETFVYCQYDIPNRVIKMYINGNLHATSTQWSADSWLNYNASNFMKFGGYRAGYGQYNGSISQAFYYNRLLSDDEIKALYGNGNYTYDNLGVENNSIYFKGNDYIIVDTSQIQATTEALTISAWINKTDSNSGYYPIAVQRDNYALGIRNNKLEIYDWGGSAWRTNGVTLLNDGVWHHVAVVFDNNTAQFYVNGQKDGATFSYTTNSQNYNLTIGHTYGVEEYSNLGIDELMIFNYALDQTEITQLYQGFENMLDDCSTGDTEILNFTIWDEDNLQPLNETEEAEIEVNIIIKDTINNVSYNYSGLKSDDNYRICIKNINISYS